jgi:hypothetical protein
VFLPSPSITTPLEEHLQPWLARKIWLEIAPEETFFRVDTACCVQLSNELPLPCPHWDEGLHCRYGMDVQEDHIDFFLQRDLMSLESLMAEAKALGVQRFVGLYQQLSGMLGNE